MRLCVIHCRGESCRLRRSHSFHGFLRDLCASAVSLEFSGLASRHTATTGGPPVPQPHPQLLQESPHGIKPPIISAPHRSRPRANRYSRTSSHCIKLGNFARVCGRSKKTWLPSLKCRTVFPPVTARTIAESSRARKSRPPLRADEWIIPSRSTASNATVASRFYHARLCQLGGLSHPDQPHAARTRRKAQRLLPAPGRHRRLGRHGNGPGHSDGADRTLGFRVALEFEDAKSLAA